MFAFGRASLLPSTREPNLWYKTGESAGFLASNVMNSRLCILTHVTMAEDWHFAVDQ